MGITKTEAFGEQTNQLADVFKAIGHPARISIIEFLAKSNTCICGDLVEVLPLAQSTISKHLSELKNANIIVGTVEGKSTNYCLNKELINSLSTYLSFINTTLGNQDQNCC